VYNCKVDAKNCHKCKEVTKNWNSLWKKRKKFFEKSGTDMEPSFIEETYTFSGLLHPSTSNTEETCQESGCSTLKNTKERDSSRSLVEFVFNRHEKRHGEVSVHLLALLKA
jgi:hypothetical protein